MTSLEKGILEYLKNNDRQDSVDITGHFKLVEPVLIALDNLQQSGKIERFQNVFGSYYKVMEDK